MAWPYANDMNAFSVEMEDTNQSIFYSYSIITILATVCMFEPEYSEWTRFVAECMIITRKMNRDTLAHAHRHNISKWHIQHKTKFKFILTFVKFGTYKWVLIVSLPGIVAPIDCMLAIPFDWPLSPSIVSVASNMGTSLKLGGFSVVKPRQSTKQTNK